MFIYGMISKNRIQQSFSGRFKQGQSWERPLMESSLLRGFLGVSLTCFALTIWSSQTIFYKCFASHQVDIIASLLAMLKAESLSLLWLSYVWALCACLMLTEVTRGHQILGDWSCKPPLGCWELPWGLSARTSTLIKQCRAMVIFRKELEWVHFTELVTEFINKKFD